MLRTFCVCLCVGLVYLVGSSTALAIRGHFFQRAFAEHCSTPPCAAGQLDEPSGLAIDEAAQVIYVADKADNRIESFNATTGIFEAQFDGSGNFTNENGATAPTPLTEPEGIAIDNDLASPSFGDVYVEDPSQGVIDKFSAQGEYITQITETETGRPFFELSGVGVNGTGELFVYQSLRPEIDRFTSSPLNIFTEGFGSVAFGEPQPGFAVEPAGSDLYVVSTGRVVSKLDATGRLLDGKSQGGAPVGRDEFGEVAPGAGVVGVQVGGDVYVDHGLTVGRFSSSGVPVESFGEGVLAGGSGVVVSSLTGDVYVADASLGVVNVFASEGVSRATVQGEAFGDVTAQSANVSGEVNPRGAVSHYRFEYGRCVTPGACAASEYEDSVPVPAGVLAGDFEQHPVQATLEGLAANSTYHFRLVAVNEKGEGPGEEQVFMTQVGGREFTLLDSRQWELVSPPNKSGARLAPLSGQGVIQAAANGSAITYLADGPTETAALSNSTPVQVFSSRGGDGWSSRDIVPPEYGPTIGAPIGAGFQYRFFSADLSVSVLQPFGLFPPPGSALSLSAQATEQTAFLREDYQNGNVDDACTSDCYRPLVSSANVPAGTHFEAAPGKGCFPICGPLFVGASGDLHHVVLSSEVALTSTPTPPGESLYEWSAGQPAGMALSLVSVLPHQPGEEAVAITGEIGSKRHAAGAVTDDGRRVVWNSKGNNIEEHLYLTDTTLGETVQLDAPQAGAGSTTAKPVFQFASSDGSRVLFTDEQALTGQSGQNDLYECAIVQTGGRLGCELSDLTPMQGGQASEVQGVLGASQDAAYVYFAANGVLGEDPHAVHGTCKGTGGKNEAAPGAVCDVYVERGGVTGLVAVVSAEDLHDWNETLAHNPSRVSPDGDWLEFMSQASLTGYDNVDVVSGRADQEVFLYHASTGALACVSCDPSGARPAGRDGLAVSLVGADKVWTESAWVAGLVPGWTAYELSNALFQSRFLSDSGRLFFDASDALVSGDVDSMEDVYEYEPVGVGVEGSVCGAGSVSQSVAFKPERSFVAGGREGVEGAGCVGVISSGAGSEESAFLDASETGEDAFFLTGARLSPQDKDSALDVYDAHACTSKTPCITPVQSPPTCVTAEACRAAPTPPPEIFGAPPQPHSKGPETLQQYHQRNLRNPNR